MVPATPPPSSPQRKEEDSSLGFLPSTPPPKGTTPSTTTGKTRSCALPIIFGVVGVLLVAGGVASGVALGLHFSHTVLLLSTPSWMPMFCILAAPVSIAGGLGCILMAVKIAKNRTEPDGQEDVLDTASQQRVDPQDLPREDISNSENEGGKRPPSPNSSLSVRPRSRILPNLPALDQEPLAYVSDGSPRYEETASAHNQALQEQEAKRARTRSRSLSVPQDLPETVKKTLAVSPVSPLPPTIARAIPPALPTETLPLPPPPSAADVIENLRTEGLALLSEASPYDDQKISKIKKWCSDFDTFITEKIFAFAHPKPEETPGSIKTLLDTAFQMQYAVSRHLYEKISKLPPDTQTAILKGLETRHWQALLPIHHYLMLVKQGEDCLNAWQIMFEFHRMNGSSFTNPENDMCSEAIANVMLLQEHVLAAGTTLLARFVELIRLPFYDIVTKSFNTEKRKDEFIITKRLQLPIATALLYRIAVVENIQNPDLFLREMLRAYGIPKASGDAVTKLFQETSTLEKETCWHPDKQHALEQKVLPSIMKLHAALIKLAVPQETP